MFVGGDEFQNIVHIQCGQKSHTQTSIRKCHLQMFWSWSAECSQAAEWNERETDGWRGVTLSEATEMPSQPEVISCGQASGMMTRSAEVPGDMLLRKPFMSLGIGNKTSQKARQG